MPFLPAPKTKLLTSLFLPQPSEYLQSAVNAATFIREKLYDSDSRTLRRSFREGPSAAAGFVDDYAFLINALLDLHEAGAGVKWLEWALELQKTQVGCSGRVLIHIRLRYLRPLQ